LKDTDIYVEKYLPIHTQHLIDETLYNTVSKTKDLFKSFNDYSKFKFKVLEEKLKSGPVADRKNYTLPNFGIRDIEISKLKNTKSKKSRGAGDTSSMASSRRGGFGMNKKGTLQKQESNASLTSEASKNDQSIASLRANKIGAAKLYQALGGSINSASSPSPSSPMTK
jgi:hypothetical protein